MTKSGERLIRSATEALNASPGVTGGVVVVCAECEIPDCHHIRARRAAKQKSAGIMMTPDGPMDLADMSKEQLIEIVVKCYAEITRQRDQHADDLCALVTPSQPLRER